MAACPYCSMELAKVPKRRSRCPHCRETIHVYRGELLTADQREAERERERGEHVATLNAIRERDLEQWVEHRAEYGVVLDVEILTMGDRSCPACQELAGRVYSLDEVLRLRPLPCPGCTTTLRNGWRNFCRCTYVAVRPKELAPSPPPHPFAERLLELILGGAPLEGLLDQVITEWQDAGREPPPYLAAPAPDAETSGLPTTPE